MPKFNPINDLFRAAANLEAETPITVGATTVGPGGRLANLPVDKAEWNQWAERFPLKDMRKLKFSVPTGSDNAVALLEFFDVPSPEYWQAAWQQASIAARQSQKFDARWEAVVAWVREAEIVASHISLAEYDECKLRASLEELRRQTRNRFEVGIERAQQICSQAGVALVVVPELPGTRLSGCARWLDDSRALIGITTRYKKDDQLWFTFFHEVGHILLHRGRLTFVIDNPADSFSDGVIDRDMATYEEEASHFASSTLISQAALSDFLRKHGKTLTSTEIHDFAESVGIGPGIVVGRLQRDGILQWHQGNALKQTINWRFAEDE